MIVVMGRCDACKLLFHTLYRVAGFDNAVEGCECNKPGCGCRLKREQENQ